jgi:hypothetical protein
MPRVPTITDNTVSLNPLTRERYEAHDVTAVGRAIGQGLEQAGGAAARYASEQDHLDAALDNAAAKTIDNEFVVGAQAIRSSFLTTQGLNAGTARKGAEQALRDLTSASLAKATTPRMRMMATGVVNQRVAGIMGEFASHASTQMFKAEDDASVARLGLAGDEAAATTDPVQRQRNIETGLNEVASRGERLGWGADLTRAEALKFTSGVHSSILQNMVTTDNLNGAMDYYASHSDAMSAPDKLRFNAMVRDPLERRQTLNDAGEVMGFAPVKGSTSVDSPIPTASGMFSTITTIESGGKHFVSPGVPVRSSKGAVGIAQVMPATGPEAAKLAGVAWSKDRFEKDPEYNARLGNAYFQKQLATFGDPGKAAAAYNAGPGRVRSAVATANAAGKPEEWINHVPAETRAYVGKFQAGTRTGVQQAPEHHDLNGLLARVDVVGQTQGWSPERIDRAKQEVTRRVGVDDSLLNRQQDDAKRLALDTIADLGGKRGGVGFTDITQLPPGVRAALSPADRLSFMSMAQENARRIADGADIKPNSADAYNLNQLAIRDPETFKRTNLGMYQNKVTAGELEGFGKLQAQMQTAGPGGVDHGKIWSAISRGAPYLGIDVSKPKDGKAPSKSQVAGQEAQQRIFSMVQADLAARTGGTRQPTDDEVQASYDRTVRQVVVNGDTANPRRAYEVIGTGPAARVPDASRQQIIAAWRRRYGRDPNEGQIASTYRNGR